MLLVKDLQLARAIDPRHFLAIVGCPDARGAVKSVDRIEFGLFALPAFTLQLPAHALPVLLAPLVGSLLLGTKQTPFRSIVLARNDPRVAQRVAPCPQRAPDHVAQQIAYFLASLFPLRL